LNYPPSESIYASTTTTRFICTVSKTKSDFRNWRQRTLNAAKSFARVYIMKHKDEVLKTAIDKDFNTAWFRDLFHFAYKAINLRTSRRRVLPSSNVRL
jgi:hypothetical protein